MSWSINAQRLWPRLATGGLVSTLLLSGGGSLIAAAQRRLEPTIASITAGRDDLDKVRSLYGKGAEQKIQDVISLCYYIEQDRAYLSVSSFEHETRVRQTSLTTFADVAPGCQDAKISGKHLAAVRGIRLGDSMAKVRSTLGPPSATGKLPMPNHELMYTDYKIGSALLTLQYENDKLVLVAVDASPE
jgi:hypothetical protein